MPILGIGYLITMVGPDESIPWAFNTFQIMKSIMESTQVEYENSLIWWDMFRAAETVMNK